MAVSSRATSSGSNTRMSARRGRASSAAAQPAPPAATAARPASPVPAGRAVGENGPVLLDEVAGTSAAVANSSARLAKVERLAACLRRLEPGEVHPAVAFLSGELRQRQIGVGWAALRDVPAPAAGPTLTVAEVDAAFEGIGRLAGPGSQAGRRRLVPELFARATAGEQRFLIGLLSGELRQGALEGVMVEAIARAAGLPAAEVRRALMLRGSLGPVAEAALTSGVPGLRAFHLEVGRPLQPMLASTARVPEVVAAALTLPVTSAVLDGEVIALQAGGRPHPFQVTASRVGSRLDVERLAQRLPLTPFLFDLLHLDGQDLIDRPGSERHAALAAVVPEPLRMPRRVTADPAVAAAFLADTLARGHEGVMVKSLAATWEAGRRGAGWLKVKPVHTLDLVVLAAEWGHGRRRGWLSNLHLGARDPGTGGFVMLGKTFKGLTDQLLTWQTRRLQELAVGPTDQWVVHVRPELVVEIAFDGVQTSPRYPGGVALRFARVLRYRPDKRAVDADTIGTVRAIHTGAPPRGQDIWG